jgi:hypothetical protein
MLSLLLLLLLMMIVMTTTTLTKDFLGRGLILELRILSALNLHLQLQTQHNMSVHL